MEDSATLVCYWSLKCVHYFKSQNSRCTADSKSSLGYTVPLDKRLAADGRGLQDVTINDKFASFAEALHLADRNARTEVKQRAAMQQKLAEKEKEAKEMQLRMLAEKAREDRGRIGRRDSKARSESRSRSSSYESESENDEATREREQMRRERRQENERKFRQSRMGAERRIQQIAREGNRDISEKVALGLAKPTQSSESMWDSRLFNQQSGFDTGFNEDQAYDKPLFAAQDAISSIYRPRANNEDEDEEGGGAEYEKIQKANRFEVLGKAKEGFKGAADAEVCLIGHFHNALLIQVALFRREMAQSNSKRIRTLSILMR